MIMINTTTVRQVMHQLSPDGVIDPPSRNVRMPGGSRCKTIPYSAGRVIGFQSFALSGDRNA
jgi:hypothetical protein